MSWTDAWKKQTNLFDKYSLTQSLEPPEASSLILFITEEDRDTIIINSNDLLGRMDHIIAIIINYNQFNHETKHIIDQKIITLQNISIKGKTKFDLIKFSSFAVSQTEILATFAEINFDITHSEVLVDITGCPSSFLVSFAELFYDNSHSTVTFSYNVASSYDVDKILQRDDLDAENYESIKTYPSDITSKSGGPKFLIIIIGHENKKSKLIAEKVKPKHGLLLNNVFSPRADQTRTAVESLNLHRDFVLHDKFG
ncbi:MAG: hypothetical protein IH840_07070, partial [Candidatus Heimdallarchaeota archaeon]|nr:hypothetical protein [Candidatus Heimdallarchaeota archaeon]